ncbi:hypothetical protein XENTR_v10003246 [Xenopus tropicalis]|uniref:Uncharacterized protein LOC101733164 isoform X1 n=1 Tax=Xenopus tropicalis TaxID=8364 RepID=A0A8J0QUL2_XENTR
MRLLYLWGLLLFAGLGFCDGKKDKTGQGDKKPCCPPQENNGQKKCNGNSTKCGGGNNQGQNGKCKSCPPKPPGSGSGESSEEKRKENSSEDCNKTKTNLPAPTYNTYNTAGTSTTGSTETPTFTERHKLNNSQEEETDPGEDGSTNDNHDDQPSQNTLPIVISLLAIVLVILVMASAFVLWKKKYKLRERKEKNVNAMENAKGQTNPPNKIVTVYTTATAPQEPCPAHHYEEIPNLSLVTSTCYATVGLPAPGPAQKGGATERDSGNGQYSLLGFSAL